MLPDDETRPVIVARDVRISGPVIQKAVIEGLRDAGADVIDIGMGPTPLAYYAVFHLDGAGCIMVTASHNPGDYNGFKMMKDRESLHGEDIQTLKNLMLKTPDKAASQGSLTTLDVVPDYTEFVQQDIHLAKPLKVVIDAGNGPSGIIAGPLYTALGCDVIELFCEPDGTFPNHHPDPTVEENMQDIAAAVREYKADLGIAFDGDGDRIGVVDENGEIIWGDMLVLIFARDILSREKGAKFIGDVKCSTTLFRGIEEAGGEAIMWKTGHSLIKDKMKVENAAMAGEMSGHIFFADKFFGYDDALYAALRLLEIISRTGKKVSELLEGIPESVSTPEIRVECPEEIKFQVVDRVKAELSTSHQVIDIDGVRIEFPYGWGLIRASNTQPALVLRFEAQDDVKLNEIRSIIEGELNSVMNELSVLKQ